MQSPTNQTKNKVAYLAAHALFLTYTEALLPRITPFFRLGLGNVVVLLSLDLNISSFLLLVLIKTLAASMMNGTLFSPFVLISMAQSFVSGFLMYGLNKIKGKYLSIFGISLCGSAVSSIVQILLCSLYLKTGVFALLGPMLLFSIASGLITATLSKTLKIEDEPPLLPEVSTEKKNDSRLKIIIMLSIITVASIAIFMIKNIYVLAGFLVLSFAAQLSCKRKIKIMPHISMWLFIILSCIFIPQGKVLFYIKTFSVTEGAILNGISKSLKLSAVMALSQCMATIRISGNSILALTIRYFDQIKLERKNAKTISLKN